MRCLFGSVLPLTFPGEAVRDLFFDFLSLDLLSSRANLDESKPGIPVIGVFSKLKQFINSFTSIGWISGFISSLGGPNTTGDKLRSVGIVCLPVKSAIWFL